MALEGRLAPHLYNNAMTYFDVTILHQCYLTTINLSQLPASVEYIMKYPATSPRVIEFDGWTESLGFCLPFVYSAIQDDGTSLPSFITFSPESRTFTLKQSKAMIPGVYVIYLNGLLKQYNL